ncbi:hypothetical protein VTN49DRAFT_2625 [Thermomyces lanuginosus]|uniref:uncharacterized protein n=1 Tax=Thermomyces lanuginosus TaxID=5541 RepID=UPI0037435073
MAPHLSNEEFFSSLSTLLAHRTSSAHGSVYLVQKRLPADPTSSSSSSSENEPAILIRATDGRTDNPNPKSSGKVTKKQGKGQKTKFSTIVKLADLEAFYARYAEVCKAGMTGLKKRDRSAKKKGKAKAKAGKS